MPENSLGKALINTYSETWQDFVQQFQSRNQRLLSELTDNWQIFQSILDGQFQEWAKASEEKRSFIDLETYKNLRAATGLKLFHEPVEEIRRRKPFRRALLAVESYRQGLDGLILSLPLTISLSGAQANAVLDPKIAKGLMRRWVRSRRREYSLPLRHIIASEIWKLCAGLTEIESRYFLALALAQRHVRKPWESVRAAIDAAVLEKPALEETRARAMEQELHILAGKGAMALSEMRAFLEAAPDQVGERILTELIWRPIEEGRVHRLQPAPEAGHWETQMRAAEAEIRLEQTLESCEDAILAHINEYLGEMRGELATLRAEIGSVLEWLRESVASGREGDFPQTKEDFLPASSRIAELESFVRSEQERLPRTLETQAKFSPLPRRHFRMRKLRPMETFRQAFSRCGHPEILNVFHEVADEHGIILQQIKRAREVVAFARESAGSGSEFDPRIVQDAIQNVTSLLEFYRNEQPEWCASAESKLAQSLASTYTECHLILGLRRLGVFTYLVRQGSRRAIVLAGSRSLVQMRRQIRRSFEILQGAAVKVLIHIGWMSAPSAGVAEVITRPYLPEDFTADLNAKDLPLIYRRLFRYEPLQDPRFLVGRGREMEAIASARSLWEASRPVALILVGQRGSGKTSLINCALKSTLSGSEVIRGEFKQRLLTESDMRAYLSDILQSGDPSTLEEFLKSEKRIVILEELERTFLRQMGHYGALRSLLRIIAATNTSTLWILSTNQVAFRFMDAAVKLGQCFSHRINAGTASREDLQQAILVRHNLSGLRIQFAPLPEPAGRIRKIVNSLTERVSPEAFFFDALSKESAGVYRSAFEIWLNQIDSVQNGALRMKLLASPDLSHIVDHLDLYHLFALMAIQQHGSLTPEEHSIVFQKSVSDSQAQLNALLATEIIEPDPVHPGFRIRPEAARLVREVLYRHNLL